VVQTFIADGADKTLRMGVHIRGIGDCGNALDAVPGIGKYFSSPEYTDTLSGAV
jgi:hypothetical protein